MKDTRYGDELLAAWSNLDEYIFTKERLRVLKVMNIPYNAMRNNLGKNTGREKEAQMKELKTVHGCKQCPL